MKRSLKLKLTQEEREKIHEKLNSNETKKSIKKRANILLLSDTSMGKPMKQIEIAARCGTSDVTVYNTLSDYQIGGLEYALTFKRTKTTNPPIVTGDIEARIVALACGKSPDGTSRWTVRLLTEKVVELQILDEVSRETIRTTLKKHDLSLI